MRAVRLIALLAVSANVADAAPPLTASTVRQNLRGAGAQRTINDLQKRGRWEAVIDKMDAGAGEWIALAPLLAQGSDAGSAEDLGISLAFALPKNPRAVLAALDARNGHILGASRVCGRPFIEDTEPAHYKAKAIAALSTVRDAGLLGRRQACLTVLRATR